MKACLAFTLAFAFATHASAFDNARFSPESSAPATVGRPSAKQVEKCKARFPADFCSDTSGITNAEQFDEVLKRLTAYNVQF